MLGVAALAEAVLLFAALQKLVVPAPAAEALRSAGLPVPPGLVRVGAGAEAVAAGGALVSGWPMFTTVVGLCYAAFAAFILRGLRRPGSVRSCGCFGAPRNGGATPPTWTHFVFDLAAAVVCGAVSVAPVSGLWSGLGRQPVAGIPLLGLVALGGWLSWMALTVAPETAGAAGAAVGGAASADSTGRGRPVAP
jgi:hypothetical protein